jgi:hypothetical protein
MPWTKEQSGEFVKGLTDAQSTHWAEQANAIRDSLLKSGKSEADADKIALATAAKHIRECSGENCKGVQPPYEDSPNFPATALGESAKGGEVAESAGTLAYGKVRFNDEKLIIENAAIFGPPLDPSCGYYVSDKGRRYARSFHDSVLKVVNEGSAGWPYHPEKTQSGGFKMRPTTDVTHRTVPGTGWIDESGAAPMVRSHVKFKNTNKGREAYESAKENKDLLGFSIFASSAITNMDYRSGRDIYEAIDTDEKRPMSVDLVEASGATGNILESAAETKKNKEPVEMTKEEIQAMLDAERKAIEESAKAAALEAVKPQLDAGKKAIDEAAAYRKEQLVASRFAEKKLDAKFITATLKKACLEAADESAVDALIDEHKAILAASQKTVTESGGEGAVVTVVKKAILEEVNDKGLSAILEEAAGKGNARERNARLKDAVVTSGLAKIANFRDQSKATNELRKAVSEQANQDPKFFRKIFRAGGVSDEVLESGGSLAQAVLETTGTPMDSTGIAVTSASVLGSEMILGYNIVGGVESGFIGREITKPYPSRVYPERYAGFTASSGIATTDEGAAANDATMDEKAVTDPTSRPKKKTVMVSLTREMVLLDKTGQVLERANRAGMDAKVQEEIDILTGVFDLNSTNSFIPLVNGSWTPTAQFTNTDGVKAIASNDIVNALVDYSDLWTAIQTLRGIKDENDRPIIDNAMQPYDIVVPHNLRELALSIVNAREVRNVENSDTTIFEASAFGFAGSRVLWSVLLPAITGFVANDWYVAGRGGFQKQYIRKELIPFEVVQVPQAEIQGTIKDLVAGVKAEYWMWVLARDQRYVLHNNAS